ncbi:helix-turn-helix transcriptional regulator [Aeromicrobium sp. CTD01-1L150]|uniref:helix-turn-helix transcriptional regulator n=1 Tax=Aeromicrobium sp. CTD01-1L150 TaxID=3341830 RepID=UPI0035BF9A7F
MSPAMNRSAQQVLRMLALVPYLQGNEGVPVAQVAREFGVRPKQIRDDLKLLMFTGVGEYAGELIDFDLGALDEDDTVFIRDADFMQRPLRLTPGEGIALIVALRTLRASAVGAQLTVVDSALAKLESAVEGEVVAPVDVHLDEDDPTIRAVLVDAVAASRRVRIEYAVASRDEHSVRDVDPRRVFTQQGHRYLEAWCLKAQDLRFFRLDRVLSATPTGEPADEHDAAPRALGESLFTVGEDAPSAVLDLEPAAHWLAEYYQVEELGRPDGLQRVRMYASDEAWLRRLVLRNAGTVHVVEPASLREDVTRAARSALSAYDG